MRTYIHNLMIALIVMPGIAYAEKTLVWNNAPLTIVIPVGEEVRVSFPADVLLQIPVTLTASLESLAPNQQTVYWKATSAFDAARVVAQSVDNKTVYLVDLVAQDGASNEAIRIEDADRIVSSRDSSDVALLEAVPTDLTDPPEIVLTRFASQTLYAPSRLIPVNADINTLSDVKLQRDFQLIRSLDGESYQLSIAGAWAGYGLYITAVLVVNQSQLRIAFNPGLVQGNFSHITAQHLYLGPNGTLEDRTTLYLISSVPFSAAILEDGYGW